MEFEEYANSYVEKLIAEGKVDETTDFDKLMPAIDKNYQDAKRNVAAEQATKTRNAEFMGNLTGSQTFQNIAATEPAPEPTATVIPDTAPIAPQATSDLPQMQPIAPVQTSEAADLVAARDKRIQGYVEYWANQGESGDALGERVVEAEAKEDELSKGDIPIRFKGMGTDRELKWYDQIPIVGKRVIAPTRERRADERLYGEEKQQLQQTQDQNAQQMKYDAGQMTPLEIAEFKKGPVQEYKPEAESMVEKFMQGVEGENSPFAQSSDGSIVNSLGNAFGSFFDTPTKTAAKIPQWGTGLIENYAGLMGASTDPDLQREGALALLEYRNLKESDSQTPQTQSLLTQAERKVLRNLAGLKADNPRQLSDVEMSEGREKIADLMQLTPSMLDMQSRGAFQTASLGEASQGFAGDVREERQSNDLLNTELREKSDGFTGFLDETFQSIPSLAMGMSSAGVMGTVGTMYAAQFNELSDQAKTPEDVDYVKATGLAALTTALTAPMERIAIGEIKNSAKFGRSFASALLSGGTEAATEFSQTGVEKLLADYHQIVVQDGGTLDDWTKHVGANADEYAAEMGTAAASGLLLGMGAHVVVGNSVKDAKIKQVETKVKGTRVESQVQELNKAWKDGDITDAQYFQQINQAGIYGEALQKLSTDIEAKQQDLLQDETVDETGAAEDIVAVGGEDVQTGPTDDTEQAQVQTTDIGAVPVDTEVETTSPKTTDPETKAGEVDTSFDFANETDTETNEAFVTEQNKIISDNEQIISDSVLISEANSTMKIPQSRRNLDGKTNAQLADTAQFYEDLAARMGSDVTGPQMQAIMTSTKGADVNAAKTATTNAKAALDKASQKAKTAPTQEAKPTVPGEQFDPNNIEGDQSQFLNEVVEEIISQSPELSELPRTELVEMAKSVSSNQVTGLPGQQEFDYDSKDGKGPVASAVIDYLKVFNDAGNHDMGNKAIQNMGAELQRAAEQLGLKVYNNRGGNFQLLPAVKGMSQAEFNTAVEALHKSISEARVGTEGFIEGTKDLPLNLSIGVGENWQSAEQALTDAKDAAKGTGRNNLVYSNNSATDPNNYYIKGKDNRDEFAGMKGNSDERSTTKQDRERDSVSVSPKSKDGRRDQDSPQGKRDDSGVYKEAGSGESKTTSSKESGSGKVLNEAPTERSISDLVKDIVKKVPSASSLPLRTLRKLATSMSKNDVTGLPGNLEFNEDMNDDPTMVSSIDLNFLRFFDMSGEGVGDAALQQLGSVMYDFGAEVGLKVYHLHGDEFAARPGVDGMSDEDFVEAVKELHAVTQNETMRAKTKDGVREMPLTASFGIGKDFLEAEEALIASKGEEGNEKNNLKVAGEEEIVKGPDTRPDFVGEEGARMDRTEDKEEVQDGKGKEDGDDEGRGSVPSQIPSGSGTSGKVLGGVKLSDQPSSEQEVIRERFQQQINNVAEVFGLESDSEIMFVDGGLTDVQIEDIVERQISNSTEAMKNRYRSQLSDISEEFRVGKARNLLTARTLIPVGEGQSLILIPTHNKMEYLEGVVLHEIGHLLETSLETGDIGTSDLNEAISKQWGDWKQGVESNLNVPIGDFLINRNGGQTRYGNAFKGLLSETSGGYVQYLLQQDEFLADRFGGYLTNGTDGSPYGDFIAEQYSKAGIDIGIMSEFQMDALGLTEVESVVRSKEFKTDGGDVEFNKTPSYTTPTTESTEGVPDTKFSDEGGKPISFGISQNKDGSTTFNTSSTQTNSPVFVIANNPIILKDGDFGDSTEIPLLGANHTIDSNLQALLAKELGLTPDEVTQRIKDKYLGKKGDSTTLAEALAVSKKYDMVENLSGKMVEYSDLLKEAIVNEGAWDAIVDGDEVGVYDARQISSVQEIVVPATPTVYHIQDAPTQSTSSVKIAQAEEDVSNIRESFKDTMTAKKLNEIAREIDGLTRQIISLENFNYSLSEDNETKLAKLRSDRDNLIETHQKQALGLYDAGGKASRKQGKVEGLAAMVRKQSIKKMDVAESLKMVSDYLTKIDIPEGYAREINLYAKSLIKTGTPAELLRVAETIDKAIERRSARVTKANLRKTLKALPKNVFLGDNNQVALAFEGVIESIIENTALNKEQEQGLTEAVADKNSMESKILKAFGYGGGGYISLDAMTAQEIASLDALIKSLIVGNRAARNAFFNERKNTIQEIREGVQKNINDQTLHGKKSDQEVGPFAKSVNVINKVLLQLRNKTSLGLAGNTQETTLLHVTGRDKDQMWKTFYGNFNNALQDDLLRSNKAAEDYQNKVAELNIDQQMMTREAWNFRSFLEGGSNQKKAEKMGLFHKIDLDSGRSIYVTPDDLMAFYSISKNEDQLARITRPVINPTANNSYQGVALQSHTSKDTDATSWKPYALTENDVKNMNSKLATLEGGKYVEFADWLSHYRANNSQKWINETTMALKGEEVATIENHYPLPTKNRYNDIYARGGYKTSVSDLTAVAKDLEGEGSLKERVENASGTVVIVPAISVFGSSIDFASKFKAYSDPLREARDVHENIKQNMEDRSLKAEWVEIGSYLDDILMPEDNGDARAMGWMEKALRTTRGNATRAALMSSLFVRFVQPGSVPTAWRYIAPQHTVPKFFKGLPEGMKAIVAHAISARGGLDAIHGKKIFEHDSNVLNMLDEIKYLAPEVYNRITASKLEGALGGGMGQGYLDHMMGINKTNTVDKLAEVLMDSIQFADALAITSLWNGVKAKYGGITQAAVENFVVAVRRTQPTGSLKDMSGLRRASRTNIALNMLTPFTSVTDQIRNEMKREVIKFAHTKGEPPRKRYEALMRMLMGILGLILASSGPYVGGDLLRDKAHGRDVTLGDVISKTLGSVGGVSLEYRYLVGSALEAMALKALVADEDLAKYKKDVSLMSDPLVVSLMSDIAASTIRAYKDINDLGVKEFLGGDLDYTDVHLRETLHSTAKAIGTALTPFMGINATNLTLKPLDFAEDAWDRMVEKAEDIEKREFDLGLEMDVLDMREDGVYSRRQVSSMADNGGVTIQRKGALTKTAYDNAMNLIKSVVKSQGRVGMNSMARSWSYSVDEGKGQSYDEMSVEMKKKFIKSLPSILGLSPVLNELGIQESTRINKDLNTIYNRREFGAE